MRRNVFLKCTLLIGLPFLLTSCTFKINEKAIQEIKKSTALHNTDFHPELNVGISKIQDEISFFGEYIKTGETNYTSVFNSNSTIRNVQQANFHYVGKNRFYEFNNNIYDSFGNNIDWYYNNSFNTLYTFNEYYYPVTSDIFNNEHYSGNSRIDYVDLLMVDNFTEKKYFSKLITDTHYCFNNCVDEHNINEKFLIPHNVSIKRLNSSQISYKNAGFEIRYTCEENKIKRQEIDLTLDNFGYKSILDLSFPFTHRWYSYEIKEVYDITNDFTFVYENQKYKARINYHDGTYDDVNYVPIDYVLISNPDISYADMAFILCKKISDDGELSNSFYTMQLTNTFEASNLLKDISLFKDYTMFYLGKDCFELNEDEKLLYLNDKYALIRNAESLIYKTIENDYIFELDHHLKSINKTPYLSTFYFYSANILDGKYIYTFKDKVLTNLRINKMIDENLMLYEDTKGRLFCFNKYVMPAQDIKNKNYFYSNKDNHEKKVTILSTENEYIKFEFEE